MGKKKQSLLEQVFQDFLPDIWKLLSETTLFLSRTKDFYLYESQLRTWRSCLQINRGNPEIVNKIRREITELRKHLRLEGYDLSLGKQNLIFEGFRNDASLGEGFRRVVLFFTDEDIYWLAGEDNHITLAEFLERRLYEGVQEHQGLRIRYKHYLWYRRRGGDLVLSGSDTEAKEDFERLKAMGEANGLLFLSRLKKLK
ncbi:MAG: hypothetical protein LBG08_03525 [Spirochaetaceae bacterium]|jgi:hypothetical protein|nr:hypothetical protein [Spirochaetaceae bacterium]